MTKTSGPTRPARDEWGVYDPEQAGLAALFARVDAQAKPAHDGANASLNPAGLERPPLRDAT